MIILLVIAFFYILIKSIASMHILQQNLYNENNRYIKWIIKNPTQVFNVWDIGIFFVTLFLIVFKIDYNFIILLCMSLIYICNILVDIEKLKQKKSKLPLNKTNRIKRLFISIIIVSLLPIIIYLINNSLVLVLLMAFIVVFNYIFVYLINLLNKPINYFEYQYFYNKAKNKLSNFNCLKVIGITGSYGKTSSKNILTAILSSKYITRTTPKNYNTPNGLMITINNHLDKFDEIFVAEMGAYRLGRIKNLCDFVHPKYAILTIIGKAHLETFGSIENIQKTKFELVESLPKDGVAVLNMDDPYQVNYKLKNKVKTIWIGIKNKDADIYASNIKCGSNGTTFECLIKGEKYKFETKLLGEHNIYNILASIALALELNVEIEDIIMSVKTLKATEHRLELKRVGRMNMLDDAYNSNPTGAKEALNVLNKMNGTKVIVTPGMVELGNNEDEENYNLGVKISEVCDYAILVGKNQTKSILKALEDNNYEKDNIFVINNVRDAYKIIDALKEEKKEIFALFENDLPDIYDEKEGK